MKSDLERFFSKTRPGPNGCILWTGRHDHGYGRFDIHDEKRGRSKDINAHRWIYLQLVGPIPDGWEVDHLCRVRDCVNIAHLEAVTQGENIRRSLPSGSLAIIDDDTGVKRRCTNGHWMTPENTIRRRGEIKCRECKRISKLKPNSRGASSARTHCPAGHPYDAQNTYVIPSTGGRTCRTCRAERARAKVPARAGR